MIDYQVFISYRRDGSADLAGRLSDRLSTLGYTVFYDYKSIHEGAFPDQILRAIKRSEDVLVLLPPNGLDRCENPTDMVRQEIAYALEQKKNVIPIFMQGFAFPEKLPDNIATLSSLQGLEVNYRLFEAFMEALVEMLHSKPDDRNQLKQLQTDLIHGRRFIELGLYDKAQECLDRAMMVEPANPEAYFLAAVALLGGKRPFLVGKASIERAKRYLQVALATGKRAEYYYLLAYIQYDFYHKKNINVRPGYQECMAQAHGEQIIDSDIDRLFALLKTEKPSEF